MTKPTNAEKTSTTKPRTQEKQSRQTTNAEKHECETTNAGKTQTQKKQSRQNH